MSRGRGRTLIPQVFTELSVWPVPDIQAMPQELLSAYSKRREAVEMYQAGEPYETIKIITGKSEDEVRRLVSRCVTPDGAGNIFGFNALLFGSRIRAYTRKKKVIHTAGSGSAGCAGALNQLLNDIPEAAELIDTLLFKRGSHEILHEARIPYYAIHKEFKKLLREKGIADHDWPFNTSNCGYNALVKYCNVLRDQNLARWIKVRAGSDALRRSNVGRGFKPLIPILRPLSHVQFDFHKVDAASIITLETEHGAELVIPLSRWHIGLLADERTHTILGVCIALEINPSGDSVLETIEGALRPAIQNDDMPGALLVDGRVLPNQLFSDLAYQGFSAIKFDNGWSNTATTVVNNLIDVIGCAVNFGPTRAWWRRSLIERIFGELTRRGLQRLPSTFGNGPFDTRNEGANEKAIKFRIMLSELTRLIFNCIKEYNETPTEGLQFSSPLRALQLAIEHPSSGFLPQTLSNHRKADLRLLQHVIECPVRGDIKKNVRPYVQIDRCRYTNNFLSNRYDYIGKIIIVYLDRRDIRVAIATIKETAEDIGALIPERRWSSQIVSVRERKLINRSGLALRTMSDNLDVVSEWSKLKKKELANQRKTNSNKIKSSKEGLSVTRLSQTIKGKDSSKFKRDPIENENVAPFDPFGLRDIPSLPSAKRRR